MLQPIRSPQQDLCHLAGPPPQLSLGHHTFGIICKGLLHLNVGLGTGLVKALLGEALVPLLLLKFRTMGVKKTVLMVVSPLWRGLGRLLVTYPVTLPFSV